MKNQFLWTKLATSFSTKRKEISFVTFTVLLFIFRTAVPFFKYPFILLYLICIIYIFTNYLNAIILTLKKYLINYFWILLLTLILVISFILSKKIYIVIFKNVSDIFIILSFVFFYTLILDAKKHINYLLNDLINLSIYLAILISFTLVLRLNPEIDYNFALIPVFMGLISIFILFRETRPIYWKIGANTLLILFTVTILLSGSRRGLFAFALILLFTIIIQIILLFKKKILLWNIGTNSRFFLITLLISAFSVYIIAFHTSYMFKYRLIDFITNQDMKIVKQNITAEFARYLSIINQELTYSKLYDKIWTKNYDPKDPDSGWGTRNHKSVNHLEGLGVEIVPKNTKGYYMDSTCNANTWRGNAYSHTIIGNDSVMQGDIVHASVYCYVSPEFDGTWVKLRAEGATLGARSQDYDLKRKGIWQKLEIKAICKDGRAPVYLYFSKYGVTDFSSLKGHVIFAYPQYKVEHLENPNNPYDPDDGWGTRNHTTIYPLIGDNVEIVPEKAKGYLMDRRCNASTWNGNAYSYTRIGNDSVKQGDIVHASVYCFVSPEFDGIWVKLRAEGATTGVRSQDYDLKRKGIWQKLEIKTKCKNGRAPVYLYFAKYGVTDFSSLKGYVIFAYPQYKVIKKENLPSVSNQNRSVHQKHINHSFNSKPKGNGLMAALTLPLSNKSSENVMICSSATNLNLKKVNSKQIVQNNMISLFILNQLSGNEGIVDQDPIRNWVAKIISEDTTYYPYHANLHVDTISDNFLGPRIARWQFALQIFFEEYSWRQKIMGGGFNFLNWYGYYFYHDKTRSDWPHNPFLSILLYSGIIGLIIYFFFLYKVFYYYIKYLKEYYIMFIFFLVSFYFSFFSGGNPFDPPVTGFFVMLPFLIHSVHKKTTAH